MDLIFKVLNDGFYRQSYDINIDTTKLLKQYAPNTYIIYQKSRKIIVVSSRDFVLVMH